MAFHGDRSAAPGAVTEGNAPSTAPNGAASDGSPRRGDVLELGAAGTRYEVVGPLGNGGSAEVLLARRLDAAGPPALVALKSIRAGLDADDDARRAFLYEAELARRLRHPNIARAYDVSFVGDRCYLVLEYVDGVTARGALRAARAADRRLSEGFCCHLAVQVAEALQHAHALGDDDGKPLGIVHRDVTAVNVMVARSGTVKLLDFGVALARLEGRDRTRTGQFRGTVAYASPEQALGQKLDHRSDLFSLAVVLVELLTGVRVFDAEFDIATVRKIAEANPEDVRAATAALPPGLAAICAKALERQPEDRFQDGTTLAAALRQYLAAAGVSYSASDCAGELRSLGLFAELPEDRRDRPARSDRVTSDGGGAGESAVPAREPGKARRIFHWARSAGAAVAVALAALAVASLSGRVQWRRTERAPPPVVASAPIVRDITPPVEADRPLVVPAESTSIPSAKGTVADRASASLVRPRRSSPVAPRTPPPERVEPEAISSSPERPRVRKISADFVDRPTVAGPEATLPRGTLVPVRLLRPLAGPNPGPAEAVVTEEVSRDGVVLVPKGSTVSCSARAPADGRVALSCDTIRASDRVLAFSGVAVGEGQHVGLRLLDDEVAAGTPFVVYISASAALR